MASVSKDFEEGGIIYVRGQKAICKRTDEYPLIFWAYEEDPSILYHRSLKDDGDMFSIHPPAEAKGTKPAVESKGESVETTQNQGAEASDSPPKTTYQNLDDDMVVCDVEAPGVVHIENCKQTTFTLDNKVSSITLDKCKDVTLNFLSVISTCEARQSVDCQIVCKDLCSSFQLEGCSKVQIAFPKNDAQTIVEVVTTECNDITLVAKDSQSELDDISHVVRSSKVSEKNQVNFNGKFETVECKEDTNISKQDTDSEEKKSENKSDEKNTEGSVGEGAGSVIEKGSTGGSDDPGGGSASNDDTAAAGADGKG